MKKTTTPEAIIEMMRNDAAATSKSALARNIGVSVVYICEILRGSRPVSDRVANYYGFSKETVFTKTA